MLNYNTNNITNNNHNKLQNVIVTVLILVVALFLMVIFRNFVQTLFNAPRWEDYCQESAVVEVEGFSRKCVGGAYGVFASAYGSFVWEIFKVFYILAIVLFILNFTKKKLELPPYSILALFIGAFIFAFLSTRGAAGEINLGVSQAMIRNTIFVITFISLSFWLYGRTHALRNVDFIKKGASKEKKPKVSAELKNINNAGDDGEDIFGVGEED